MSTLDFNDVAVNRLLRGAQGPVMLYCERLGERVEKKARANASGLIIQEQSGNLLGHLQANKVMRAGEPYVEVGTTATSSTKPYHGLSGDESMAFAYPTYLEKTGKKWLTTALSDVISGLG